MWKVLSIIIAACYNSFSFSYSCDPCLFLWSLSILVIHVYSCDPCLLFWCKYILEIHVYSCDRCLLLWSIYILVVHVYSWDPYLFMRSMSIVHSCDQCLFLLSMSILVIHVYSYDPRLFLWYIILSCDVLCPMSEMFEFISVTIIVIIVQKTWFFSVLSIMGSK